MAPKATRNTPPELQNWAQEHMGTRVSLPDDLFQRIFDATETRPKGQHVRKIASRAQWADCPLLKHGVLDEGAVVLLPSTERGTRCMIVRSADTLSQILGLAGFLPATPAEPAHLLSSFVRRYFGAKFAHDVATLPPPAAAPPASAAADICERFFQERLAEAGRGWDAAYEVFFRGVRTLLAARAKYAADLCSEPFCWSHQLSGDSLILFLDHATNSYEMRMVAQFMERCIAKFAWPVAPRASEGRVEYPATYAGAVWLAPFALSLAHHYRNSFLYAATSKTFRHDAAVLSSFLAYAVMHDDDAATCRGQPQLLTLMLLSLAVLPFTFRFGLQRQLARKRLRTVTEGDGEGPGPVVMVFHNKSRFVRLRHYRMAPCTEDELLTKLRLMYGAMKAPFVATLRRLRDARATDFDFGERGADWMLHTFFCVTLFYHGQDARSPEYNSIFLRPYLNYEAAYHMYRILREHHALDPQCSALLCLLDPFVRLVKRPHTLEPAELMQPLELAHQPYATIALLFHVAYRVQSGALPVPEAELAHVRKLYVSGVDLQIEMEADESSAPRRPDSGGVFFATRHLADVDRLGDDVLFGLMMRFIECFACPACRAGRRACAHYSAAVPPVRRFADVALVRTPSASNQVLSTMSCPYVLHLMFSGADDFALRHRVVAAEASIERLLPSAF